MFLRYKIKGMPFILGFCHFVCDFIRKYLISYNISDYEI